MVPDPTRTGKASPPARLDEFVTDRGHLEINCEIGVSREKTAPGHRSLR